ncbi:hypothetical protein [Roseovarius sp. 2305UL8-3]|uniref:hypothetical protein n=1 Tax=Roseovarius conchicola TaxID=3121636 RepID=UPI00352894CC
MIAGLQTLRQANQHYDALRDSELPGVLIGLGLGGSVMFLFGIIMMARAMYRLLVASSDGFQDEIEEAQPARQTSGWLRLLFSLLGFVIGAIACFYMFMVSAARYIDTETSQLFQQGGVFIVFCLIALSLLFGLVGVFLRGFALGRVPVYFLFGGMLTYAAVRILGFNMLEWQDFVVRLQ